MFRALLLAALLLPASFCAIAAEININTADADTLQQLDGVGPVKAEAIVQYRKGHDGFASVDDLVEVDGIGAATLDANRERLSAK